MLTYFRIKLLTYLLTYLMFITYYLSDRAESVDFGNLWSKKDFKHSTTEQIAMLLYNDNIIAAGAISNIGFIVSCGILSNI